MAGESNTLQAGQLASFRNIATGYKDAGDLIFAKSYYLFNAGPGAANVSLGYVEKNCQFVSAIIAPSGPAAGSSVLLRKNLAGLDLTLPSNSIDPTAPVIDMPTSTSYSLTTSDQIYAIFTGAYTGYVIMFFVSKP